MTTGEYPRRTERIEIEGPDGLALRQLIPEDAQAYYDALWHDPTRFKFGEEVTNYRTVEDVLRSILDPDPGKIRWGEWDNYLMVATINLTFNAPRSAEIGYWSGYSGHDYCRRAVELLAPYAFTNFDIHRITAWVAPENIGSIKALERNGFQRLIDSSPKHFYELRRTAPEPWLITTSSEYRL